MINKLSLKAKLILLCTSLTLFTALVGAFAYRGMEKVNESNSRVTDIVVPNLSYINSMALEYRRVRITVRTLGLEGLTAEQSKEAIEDTLKAISRYEDFREKYYATPSLAGEKELDDELNNNWLHFKAIGEKAISLYKTGTPESRKAMMKIFLEDCPQAAKTYSVSLEKLIKYHNENLKHYTEESKNIMTTTNTIIILLTLAAIAISLISGILFASKLSSSINAVVSNLQRSSNDLSNSSQQIATSSDQLAQATTEQAASLQETSSSIEEIKSMVVASTANAKDSTIASGKCLETAEKGKEVVQEVIKAISQINVSNNNIMEQINQNNKEIEDIVKLISEIGNKTKVINDIVFQTKLLSFNASVEAARAGENGKGFAVVAQEVGNLAAMSGTAAVEISSMLETSISRVESIVKNSQDKIGRLISEGKISIEEGTRVAGECGIMLDEIVKSVANVSNAITEISTACQEQSLGVQEVTKAISQLDQVTQENATSSSESSNAASNLSQQALSLDNLVYDLVKIVEGNKDGKTSKSNNENLHSETNKIAKVLTLSKRIPSGTLASNKTESLFPSSDDRRFSDV